MATAQHFDRLWVPVLTHYNDAETPRLDRQRTIDHLRYLTPHVTQFLIAGTTGAGWKMSEAVLGDWLDLVSAPGALSPQHTILFGAFGETARAVIARAQLIERHLDRHPPVPGYAGLTICAPVLPNADQKVIMQHFRDILEATRSPVAIYQLPQITKCEIAPETFAELAQSEPRITLFKDTSGTDSVAKSDLNLGAARLLRGAEGNYFEHLKPAGPYDGWLLSTANVFALQIRSIAVAAAEGRQQEAASESGRLTKLVSELFSLAQKVEIGNPFSNSNRAVDHVNAYGKNWPQAPLPRITSGESLPEAFIAEVEQLLNRSGFKPSTGYRKEPLIM